MNASSNGKALVALTKELLLKWGHTKQQWKDAKSAEFEKRYLAELEAAVTRANANLEELDKLMGKVRRDCE